MTIFYVYIYEIIKHNEKSQLKAKCDGHMPVILALGSRHRRTGRACWLAGLV